MTHVKCLCCVTLNSSEVKEVKIDSKTSTHSGVECHMLSSRCHVEHVM